MDDIKRKYFLEIKRLLPCDVKEKNDALRNWNMMLMNSWRIVQVLHLKLCAKHLEVLRKLQDPFWRVLIRNDYPVKYLLNEELRLAWLPWWPCLRLHWVLWHLFLQMTFTIIEADML